MSACVQQPQIDPIAPIVLWGLTKNYGDSEHNNTSSLDEKYFSFLPESSTDLKKEEYLSNIFSTVSEKINTIFRDGKNEVFEAGMVSNFGLKIEGLILIYGKYVTDILSKYLNDATIDIELLSEALRIVGSYENASTKVHRFRLLISALKHSSPVIRDSAALGIADMDDPKAIPYLREAIDKEPYKILQADFEQIIDDLGAI